MVQQDKNLNIASHQCNVGTSEMEIRILQIVGFYKIYLVTVRFLSFQGQKIMVQQGKKLNIDSHQCNVETREMEIRKLQIVDRYKIYLITTIFTFARTEDHDTTWQEVKYCF